MQSVSAGKITPLAEEFPRQAGREKAGAGLLHSGLCGPTLHSRARTVPPAIPPGKPFWPSLERCSSEQKKLINLQIALFHRCFAQPWIHGGDCGRMGAVSAGHTQGEQLSHQHHQHRQSSGGCWPLELLPFIRRILDPKRISALRASRAPRGTREGHRVLHPGFPAWFSSCTPPTPPALGFASGTRTFPHSWEPQRQWGSLKSFLPLLRAFPRTFLTFLTFPFPLLLFLCPFLALCPFG